MVLDMHSYLQLLAVQEKKVFLSKICLILLKYGLHSIKREMKYV